MQTVLITGGTGLIGQHLTKVLQERNYRVIYLSHSINLNSLILTFFLDIPKNHIDDEAIQQADIIIHLAGAGIADKRWTTRRKQEIIDSRCKSTKLIYESIARTNKKINVFISSSAVGFYGAETSNKILDEEDKSATDFLGVTCKLWEQSSEPIINRGIRTVIVRTGVVLSSKGGALAKISSPVKYFIGAALGSGKQFMPWIHIEDLCQIFIKCIEDETMKGAYNAVSPEHITNRELTKAIAVALHKPILLPNAPSFLLKVLFGELSIMLLNGSRVSSQKLIKSGFVFNYPYLNDALKNLFK